MIPCSTCGSATCNGLHAPRPFSIPRDEPEKAGKDYYGGDACWRAIEAAGFARGFDLGNVMKYVWRAGRKEGSTALADLRKARDYLDRAIGRLEDDEG